MNNQMFELVPKFREKIWGGKKLHEIYGFNTGFEQTGEAWIVTSLAGNEDNSIVGSNLTLSQLYKEHRELFGNITNEICPIKDMIVDTKQQVSIQCHPNDEYGMKHDNSLGKPEGLLIISVEPGSKMEFGHNAKNKEELRKMVYAGEWDKLLRYEYPKEGDFIYVPSGIMHAVGKGIVLFEVSRNADLTYRLYDYDRVDKNGNKRQLNIEKSLDILEAPSTKSGVVKPEVKDAGGLHVTTYFDKPGEFTFRKINCESQGVWEQPEFGFYFINSGEGTINNQEVSKGQTWLIPSDYGKQAIKGKMEVLISSYRSK